MMPALMTARLRAFATIMQLAHLALCFEGQAWAQPVRLLQAPASDPQHERRAVLEGKMPRSLLKADSLRISEGAGFRVAWNQKTIVSVDYGVSEEDSQLFVALGHVF
jgi:hypothetical protein